MTYRVAVEADGARVAQLVSAAFNFPADPKDLDLPTVRVLEVDGSVRACLKIHDFGHYYGGREVKAYGIGGVAVAAEARGKGVGTAIMRAMLEEARSSGIAISSLYPATLPIYRSAGYGVGAHRTSYKSSLSDLPRTSELPVAEMRPEDHAEVRATYARIAPTYNGLVARPDPWWEKRVLNDDSPYRFLVREGDQITGWMIYGFGKRSGESWKSPLAVRDLYWETPGAARSLLALAAGHRSTCTEMRWIGPHDEPLMSLTPDHAVEITNTFRSMVRVVDLPAAFEARGYPGSVEASFTLGATDKLLPENEGPWHIEVREGAAKVVAAPGAQPDVHADISMWASVWAGMYSARDAVRLGALHAEPAAIEMLEALFAGPTPWIGDFY